MEDLERSPRRPNCGARREEILRCLARRSWPKPKASSLTLEMQSSSPNYFLYIGFDRGSPQADGAG